MVPRMSLLLNKVVKHLYDTSHVLDVLFAILFWNNSVYFEKSYKDNTESSYTPFIYSALFNHAVITKTMKFTLV